MYSCSGLANVPRLPPLFLIPRMKPDEFLDFMMADFGINCDAASKGRRLLALNNWLLERHAVGQPVVLIVDEAQQLSAEMLEELRLLTNLETPTHKLLQIVLSGQNELDSYPRIARRFGS